MIKESTNSLISHINSSSKHTSVNISINNNLNKLKWKITSNLEISTGLPKVLSLLSNNKETVNHIGHSQQPVLFKVYTKSQQALYKVFQNNNLWTALSTTEPTVAKEVLPTTHSNMSKIKELFKN